MGEFFETVFNLDNRLFRTLAALAVPGRLTNNFLGGKQKPYFHPLRLFFISGVLMVGAYSFFLTQSIGDSLDKDTESKRASAYEVRYGERYEERLRVAIDSVQLSYPSREVAVATDSLFQLLALKTKTSDSTTIGYLRYEGSFAFSPETLGFRREELMLLTPTELLDLKGIEGFFNRFQLQQIIRLNRMELNVVTTLMGQTIWGLLLLVPLSAGLLKLLYIRRKRKYIEHFVFSLNVHAFLFLTQFLGALEFIAFGTPVLCILSGIATVGYFLLALKRVYRQSWWKTLIKAWLMANGYLMLIPIAAAVAALIAITVF